jgi:acyl-CoA reductase-like NAD-dependent aldehyde dehydrogenase
MTATDIPSQRQITIVDPSDGTTVGAVPTADAAEVEEVVGRAASAQGDWSAKEVTRRAAALKRIARAVRGAAAELAERNARETGKLVGDARGGVEAAAATIEQYAELGPLHRGASLHGAALAHDATVHVPRGVVAVIAPFNDPIAIAAQGLAAALVTGNTVVLKPSERSPLCSALLFALFAAELPNGVVGLVQGDGRAGASLTAHPAVDVVLHTGSVRAGRSIAEACARRGAKALLELGGNDPLVIDGDVDVEWAAAQAVSGAFANAGQICTSVERIYVHEAIAAPFLDALVRQAEGLTVGPATDPATRLGPLVDRRARDTVHGHVAAAVQGGAEARCGGEPGPHAFYPATVLTGVTEGMSVMREEVFGPVAPVAVVGSFDEGLSLAAATRYGLAATVLTCSQEHAARAIAELPVGTVKVNAVWGGAPGGTAHPRGISGFGLGYGPELLDELTAIKAVHAEPGVCGR